MPAEAIKIRATAAKLYKETSDAGIKDYMKMPLDDLRVHIDRIKSGKTAPAKGKATAAPKANGATVQKGKAATAAPAKGKTSSAPAKGKSSASTSAPAAQSAARKPSPAKGKAAQGEAKRPTAAAGKGKATTAKGASASAKGKSSATPVQTNENTMTCRVKGCRRSAPTRGRYAGRCDNPEHRLPTAELKTVAKGKATSAKPAAQAKATTAKRKPAVVSGRNPINASAVNWDAEWGGGKTGKRAKVMDALRKHEGDYAKVFKALRRYAVDWYPDGGSAGGPESMLKWLIGRVAFDFTSRTAQHEQGQRTAYGTSDNPKDVRRREAREAKREEAAKVERSAKRKATAAAKAKPAARGKAAPAARKGKPAAAKGRTTAVKGKGK